MLLPGFPRVKYQDVSLPVEREGNGFVFPKRGSSGLILGRVGTSLQGVVKEARPVSLFLFFGVTEGHREEGKACGWGLKSSMLIIGRGFFFFFLTKA